MQKATPNMNPETQSEDACRRSNKEQRENTEVKYMRQKRDTRWSNQTHLWYSNHRRVTTGRPDTRTINSKKVTFFHGHQVTGATQINKKTRTGTACVL